MLPDDLDAISELEKVNKQNQENMQNNIENMQNNGVKNKEFEVGDTDVEISRQEDDRTKKNISEDKPTDTK